MKEEIKYYIVASRGRDNDSDRVWKQKLEINKTGFTNTITSVAKDNWVLEIKNMMNSEYRLRKLTPCEYARLFGLTKEDDDKLVAIEISNSQRYKIYGNGIVVNCIELLFEHLYKSQYNPEFKCYDEKLHEIKEEK